MIPLAVDNEFIFTIDRRDKLNVLILDAGRPRQSFYLQTAFTSSGDLPFAVTIENAQNANADNLGKYQVVIVNDAPRLTDRVRDRLAELRKTGQGQLVLLGSNSDLGWWGGVSGFPVKPLRKIFVSKDRGRPYYSLTTVNRSHAIFKPFQSSAVFSLSTAQFFAYTEMEPKPGASVLAKLENGSPALVESPGADSGMLVYASSVDNPQSGWSDLPWKPSFPPFFHEMVRYLTRYNESKGWYGLGEGGIPIIASQESSAAAVIKPDGERQALGDLKPGEQRFFTPVNPGFHELRVGRDQRTIAVNPPSNEANLDGMPPDDLLASVQKTISESRGGGGILTDSEESDYARRQTLWWYLLMIALLAGIAEIYIANRGQRAQAEPRRL